MCSIFSAVRAGIEPFLRGVGGNRVVFIKDGRRTNDGYAGGGGYLVGRNYFDVAGVKQVEVAKGAASSLYGSDALGGIVVITTKDPSDYLVDQQSLVKVALGYQGQSNQVAHQSIKTRSQPSTKRF